MKCAQIIGVTVSETIAEITIENVRVRANSCISRPTMPVMKRTGMKAAINDTEIEMTVKPIWRAPSSAACTGFIPRSMLR